MTPDTREKLSPTTVFLHWVVGLTIIGLLAVGVYMAETETFALYPWHKSFGQLIFVFVLLRVIWRIHNGWPTPIREYLPIEQLLAKVVHYVLLIGTVLMPLSGFIMSAVGGNGVEFFGIEIVARNPDPADPKKVIAHSEAIAGLASAIHQWVGYTLIAALVLHVAGALKHHVVHKDGTLRRMQGQRV